MSSTLRYTFVSTAQYDYGPVATSLWYHQSCKSLITVNPLSDRRNLIMGFMGYAACNILPTPINDTYLPLLMIDYLYVFYL